MAVVDQNRAPVSGATVTARWTLANGTVLGEDTVTSGGGGVATFSMSGDGGIYYLTVTDMTKDGYTFDPDHGVLTGGLAKF